MQKLTGTLQPYAWGSSDGIPAVLGTIATGEPQAEYWLGAHAKAPATCADGTDLATLLAERPELIGTATLERFGARLPFLLKVLSARQALSLQAHPSRAQAIEEYARENAAGIPLDAPERNYRDDWPKPEAMIALTEFHGLCGFRDPGQTQALFARLGVPAADLLVQPLAEPDGIARVFLEILALADLHRDLAAEVIEAARSALEQAPNDEDFGVAEQAPNDEDFGVAEQAPNDEDFGVAEQAPNDEVFRLFCTTAVEIGADYPGDASLLAALLLNRICLQPGEAFFMPAGNLHAYLRGTGIEIMANSDNVLRGGLTPKYIDVDGLARILDFLPGFPGLIEPVEIAPGLRHYPTPAPEFAVFQLTEPTGTPLPATGSARIVLVTEGSFTAATAAEQLPLAKGESAFFAAGEQITVTGSGQAYLAAGGLS